MHKIVVLIGISVMVWLVSSVYMGARLANEFLRTGNTEMLFGLWVVATMLLIALIAFLYPEEDTIKVMQKREQHGDLVRELAVYLEPLKMEMDRAGVPAAERKVEMTKGGWIKHHRAGIDMILGIRIIWK